ncbi:putative 2OG-Fe(II) oxygenase [Xanthomonas sp. XNM01]|uniref:putative 2OG-Fe(II) oxygenase n=1 Tax=Xanthomonas sp. XNM01 TaxID=2769289 RepID=UPI001781B6F1|nr:putative 2OG-Fe(II) oxygenase [Xanthomonas sp. XNM01]MBD9367410.1 tetratricopeptide repeat protein [Xanthomonas sp. XNM01]
MSNRVAGIIQHAKAIARSGPAAIEAEESRLRSLARSDDAAPIRHAALLATTGRADKALALLDEYLSQAQGDSNATLLRAIVRSAVGRFTDALEDLDRLIVDDPDDVDVLIQRAETLFRVDRLAEAHTDFSRVILLEPTHHDARANAALVSSRQGFHQQALEQYVEADHLSPGAVEVRRGIANALRALGRTDEALQVFEALVGAGATGADASNDHALALLVAGRPAEARLRYAEALRRAPSDQTALAGLYMTSHALGDRASECHLMAYDELMHVCSASDMLELTALAQAARDHPGLIWEPAGRSTVGGQQSAMLEFDRSPVLAPLQQVLVQAIGAHMRRLGSQAMPPRNHPWLATLPRRWTLQAWITALHAGGHQSPHIHPSGWLSGVIYLDPGRSDARDGALVFGYPPAETGLAGDGWNTRCITPEPGLLVLFPSYFLHHTTPYQHRDTPRISIAFDVIPLR